MEKKIKKINKQSGVAMLISVISFLFISVAIISGLVSPSVREFKNTSINLNSKKSYFLAESGTEDAVYRIKTGKPIGASEILTLGTSSATTTITNVSGNQKDVSTVGDTSAYQRKVDVSLTTSSGASFNYGVQTGRGGIVFNNGSSIIGNVYSNGDLTGSGSITGTAIAANSAALTADQANDTPTTPPSSIDFRNGASTIDFAQSFQVSIDSPINKVQFYIKKVGSPANATVRLVTDSSLSPSTNNLLTTQGTLSSGAVTTSYGWAEVVFANNPTLFADTTYWVVISNSTSSSSNYYIIGANDGVYTNGVAKTGIYSGAWNAVSPATLDSYFKIYLGGLTSTIDGIAVGSNGVGDAWAHTITGGSVVGTKYCQVGTNCNTSRGDPPPTGFPISDANIEAWKAAATAGGVISGNKTLSGNESLGPKEITGNLIVEGGNILTVTGTLWVRGNITVDNNGKIQLVAGYGSNDGIIIADGKIIISNNGIFAGSGATGSYIMALTTSDCPASSSCGGANAVEVSNNAGAVILNAQRGTIHLNNNANLIEATGDKLLLDNNATVTYESGLADVNFSNGPGGSWSLSGWKEAP